MCTVTRHVSLHKLMTKNSVLTYCFAVEKRKSKESTIKLHKNVP